jgi:hypothetical protein
MVGVGTRPLGVCALTLCDCVSVGHLECVNDFVWTDSVSMCDCVSVGHLDCVDDFVWTDSVWMFDCL